MDIKRVAILSILITCCGFFLFPLFFLIPPLGFFLLLIVSYTFFLLPFILLLYAGLLAVLAKNKLRFIPAILILVAVFCFKLGLLWLLWLLVSILTIIAIFLSLEWCQKKKNSILRISFVLFGLILICNLFLTLNPFVSFFGFLGSGKLISLSIKQGNPCAVCQEEKWNCKQFSAEAVCNDIDNIKNCYCCECIRNLKFCTDCFLFWNNGYRCDSATGKCAVGW